MKTKRFVAAMLFALGLIACQPKEQFRDGDEEIVFHADYLDDGPGTKTVLQSDGSVLWSPSDAIDIFSDDAHGIFVSQNTSMAPTADFKNLSGDFSRTSSGKYWALYPASDNNEFSGSTVTVTLPGHQAATAGTFQKDLFLAAAVSDDENLHFMNICGGIRFSVTRDGIRSVTFKGNNDEVLAGKVEVEFGQEGIPVVKNILDGERAITLTAPDDNFFAVGEWYYIVALPTVLENGYTMTFDGSEAIPDKVGTTSVEIRRSSWGSLPDADPYEVIADIEENTVIEALPDTLRFNIYAEGPWYIEVEQDQDYPETRGADDFVKLSVTSGGSGVVGVEVGLSPNYALLGRAVHLNLHHQKKIQKITIVQNPRIYVSSNDYALTIALIEPGSLAQSFKDIGISDANQITDLRLLGWMNDQDFQTLSHMYNLAYLDARGIRSDAFSLSYRSKLEYLFLPNALKELKSYAISSNNSLKYVYGLNVSKIGYNAVSNCPLLQECYFPAVEEIGSGAFASCSSLTSLVFPMLRNVEVQAFNGCSSVSIVSLDNLEELPSGVLDGWVGPCNIEILNLPKVRKLGDRAFYKQQKLKFLGLPCVTEIGYSIIADSSIEEVIFPALASVSERAFVGADNLRSVYFENADVIGAYAFANCDKLKDVIIPHATTLNEHAFYACTLGGQLDFSSVEFIGDHCFEKSSGIGSDVVRFPAALWIGQSAFQDCIGLSSIEIPYALYINGLAFYGCSKLVSVSSKNVLPTLALGDYAFYRCSSLNKLEFPLLTELGSSCFDFTGLTSLAFGNLPWKNTNEYGFALPPFDYWAFPIDGNTAEHISLRINDLDTPLSGDDLQPWWRLEYDGTYSFLRKSWASVSLYDGS